MRSRRPAWLAAIVAGLVAAAPIQALAQSTSTEDALRQRVEELEAKLKRLEERLEQQAAGAPVPAPVAAPLPAASTAPVVATPATDQPSPREEALEQQVQALDQQVRVLGRKQELDREAAEARQKEQPVAFVNPGTEGVGIRTPDNAFMVRFRAHLQADSRWFEDNSGTDQFLMRRVRPIVEGTLYEKFGFRIMPEFGSGGFELLDAYVDANLFSYFKIRAGKMKGPVGLERLESPADLLMMERGFPTQLVPNRDIGIQFSGELFDRILTYQTGVFDGTIDGTSTNGDNNNAKDFETRFFARPFRNTDWDALRGLGVGVAFTSGMQAGTVSGSNLPKFNTPGQVTFFTYAAGAYADGSRDRYVPQLYYSWDSFGLLSEYAVSAQRVTRATNTRTVRNSAWTFTASWVLTGEDASYSGVNPRRPFNPEKGNWGAFELVGRLGELDVDDDVFAGSASTRLANPGTQASRAKEYGLGLTWYLNKAYRLMFNYEHTSFDGGAPDGGDRPDEKVFMTRIQLHL